MKKLVATMLSAGLLLGSSAAFADINVGVIDLHKILEKSPQVKTINDQLKQKFGPQEEKVKKAQENLQNDIKKLQRDNAVMSEADRKKLQTKIMKEQQDLRQMSMTFQEEATAAQTEAMQKLLSNIQSVVKSVADKNKLDLVLQRDGVPYFSEKLDITNQVITGLDAQK